MFDLSAGSRGIQQEAQMSQIGQSEQNKAFSMFERQQNMRLKEVQNERQQMLAETQIKMNEANLSAMEYDLDIKKKTQDAIIEKAKYDNEKALFELEKSRTYMKEELSYREGAKNLNEEYESILSIEDEDERLKKLSGFAAKTSSIAKRFNLPDYAEFSGIAKSDYEELNGIKNLNDQAKSKQLQYEAEFEQLKKMKSEGLIGESQGGRVGTTSISGVGYSGSAQSEDEKIIAKIRRNPSGAISGLYKDVEENFIIETNPEVVVRDLRLMQKAGINIDPIIKRIKETAPSFEFVEKKMAEEEVEQAPSRNIVDPSSATISDIVSGNVSFSGNTGYTTDASKLMSDVQELANPKQQSRRRNRSATGKVEEEESRPLRGRRGNIVEGDVIEQSVARSRARN